MKLNSLILILASLASGSALANEFEFSPDLPPKLKKMIAEDLTSLKIMAVTPNEELRNDLGVQNLDGLTLHQWFAERVQLFVGEQFDLRTNFVKLQDSFQFEFPELIPVFSSAESLSWIDALEPHLPEDARSPGLFRARNLGIGLYVKTKAKGELWGLSASAGVPAIPLSSPLAGIVQIGAGLEAPLSKYGITNPQSTANRLARLAALLHEARHSDGNSGSGSLGFSHVVCPHGHDKAGAASCDTATNGSYKIQALFLESIAGVCGSCSPEEKNALTEWTKDANGRILTKAPRLNTVAMANVYCARLEEKPPVPSDALAICNQVRKNLDMVTAAELDDRPEGRRQ